MVTERPADFSNLPDLVDDTVHDSPVIERERLEGENATRIGSLVTQGVILQDSNPLITALMQNALLEEIVRRVAGDEAAERAMLNAQKMIADFLDKAEAEVRKAKLAAPLPNREARRHGG